MDTGLLLYFGGGTLLFFFWVYGIYAFVRDTRERYIPLIRQYRAGRKEQREEEKRQREREEKERRLY